MKNTNKIIWLDIKNLIKDYPFSRYLSKYRKRYLLGFVWLLFVDFLNVVQPLIVKGAMDALVSKQTRVVVLAGAAYFMAMTLQSVGRYWWRVYLIGTANFVSSDLRREFYEHLQKIPLSAYHKHRTGDLMSRATNDIEAIRMALGPGILVALDAVIMFVMLVPAMLWLSVKMTLLTFALYPLVPWLTAKLGNKIDLFFEKMQAQLSHMSAYAQEIFSGIRLIKSLVLEDQAGKKFRELSKDYVKEGNTLARYESVFSPTLGLITQCGTLFILFFGAKDVVAGVITVGTFIAFQRFVVQLSWPMEAIGWSVTMTREAKAAERRLEEIFTELSVQEKYPEVIAKSPDYQLEITDLKFNFGSLASQSFTLSLEGLEISPGRKVGLVGAVGSGKSTLFNLLIRLYEPPPGTVFLKGKDIRAIPLEELRQRVASVEQQVVLFGETISTNLNLGLLEEGSAAEVERATRTAGIFTEIMNLPKEFDTALGEKGINLSGGQKQRVALARALLRKPELLLLDDCFSAVDVEHEQQIIDRFFEAYPHLTVLFSSHRLSVMPRMDEIWLMSSGKIVARGSHVELMKSCSLYRELWRESEREQEREIVSGVVTREPSPNEMKT
ncbi:MAG: ABC transporter ATP-binding protein [Proteobacteria bacterium]|nr:ABC transporter ATP-binding protein [Pseudomonadota bacterium]NDC23762.1 ABC transporter ATP-binding protein [Pseudomonadota bacterium]NDD03961.1 ABC transporter ATP-binding protein [Pseudomonadota bacterium]